MEQVRLRVASERVSVEVGTCYVTACDEGEEVVTEAQRQLRELLGRQLDTSTHSLQRYGSSLCVSDT